MTHDSLNEAPSKEHYWAIRWQVRLQKPDEFARFSFFIQRLCLAGLDDHDKTLLAQWAFDGGEYHKCDIKEVLADLKAQAVIRRAACTPELVAV